jgi:hypothetical protein
MRLQAPSHPGGSGGQDNSKGLNIEKDQYCFPNEQSFLRGQWLFSEGCQKISRGHCPHAIHCIPLATCLKVDSNRLPGNPGIGSARRSYLRIVSHHFVSGNLIVWYRRCLLRTNSGSGIIILTIGICQGKMESGRVTTYRCARFKFGCGAPIWYRIKVAVNFEAFHRMWQTTQGLYRIM